MDFIKPVSIIFSGIFTGSMIHTFIVITPFIQPVTILSHGLEDAQGYETMHMIRKGHVEGVKKGDVKNQIKFT